MWYTTALAAEYRNRNADIEATKEMLRKTKQSKRSVLFSKPDHDGANHYP